jgi:predicted transposase YdaD
MTTKKYDPTLKALVESDPSSWPALLGEPTEQTEVIDADIGTVSGAADKVLRVAATPPYLLHLEFVTGHDAAQLPRKLNMRNALLEDRHDLCVLTGVVLLRSEADSPQLTGHYQRAFPEEPPYRTFRYEVRRVWELSPEPLLRGGLGLLPLAPISQVTEAALPGIIQRMEQRLSGRRARKKAQAVWDAEYVLLGLRYSADVVDELFRGVRSMKESSTYQAIIAEGRTQGELLGMKKALRLQGDELFGPPDARIVRLIERLDNVQQLEELLRRVPTAQSWQELFGSPGPRRRGRS